MAGPADGLAKQVESRLLVAKDAEWPERCRSNVWGPGAGVEAAGRRWLRRKGQGSQAYPVLPSACQDDSYSKQDKKARNLGSGLREDQVDGTGLGFGR